MKFLADGNIHNQKEIFLFTIFNNKQKKIQMLKSISK